MATETKTCRTCGDKYESPIRRGQSTSTVNCPSCRQKAADKRYRVTSSEQERQAIRSYTESKHTCKTCGETFNRGDALRHRRETGHRF